jgi:phosphohistidine swiveling domain-containing protein
METNGFVVPLSAGSADPGEVGGKGASLARLVALGHRVPPGFVITTAAFRATMAELGLDDALGELNASLASSNGAASAGERIRSTLSRGPIPRFVFDQVLAQIEQQRVWDNAARIIARSSATAEDATALSFAGIFESIPIEDPAELEPTIRAIWSSAFSPRALAYVKENGLTEIPAVAVIVQRFLEATRSGVMFTRFAGPDDEPRILVEHVEGGCEKLVKGEVTPERLWLDGSDAATIDRSGLLAPDHVRELTRLARDLEAAFGRPQDVEWVIDDNVVHLVQSRPITTGFGGPKPAMRATPTPALLRGVGASRGAGSGPVHLVFNVEQALQLERGQVLVTPMTNPDMVVAMRNSAAIVTDVGGMICHAAIVSRELGLPCVVGTETATVTLAEGQTVTVDGSTGAVYSGALQIDGADSARPWAEWADLWSRWEKNTRNRPDLIPILPTVDALDVMPTARNVVALVPDLDLRADSAGRWHDVEALARLQRLDVLERYVHRLSRALASRGVASLYLLSLGSIPRADLQAAIERHGDARIHVWDESEPAFDVILSPVSDGLPPRTAIPLGAGATLRSGRAGPLPGPRVGGMADAISAGLDTLTFFGHRPGVKVARMPDPAFRRRWWTLLPEYGRFHREHATEGERAEYEWLEVRPELVISPLLKSLVQPGFEMVPRVLGFRDLPPMHVKWIRGRYHFRADVFARQWAAIVRATWDERFMADLMRRVAASYRALEEVLCLFPATDAELANMSGCQMVALITSWWPRWVEFFALCWFIQAQGDDVLYPFIDETVADNLNRIGDPPGEFTWPLAADLVAPTTSVLSGDYMASVGRLREQLLAAGLTTRAAAEAALDRGDHEPLARHIAEHLASWHWMRDRDLFFEPWDTRGRVIETALKTEPHAVVPYADNLRRNLLALGFHVDLAHASGRALGLNHAARFLHDLNVERENHHVLWLKYSYALRRVCLELERRLVALGSLEPGDIFFLQAPELIAAAADLPAPLPAELVARVKNRRLGFLHETRLAVVDADRLVEEDDYF